MAKKILKILDFFVDSVIAAGKKDTVTEEVVRRRRAYLAAPWA
jgi:hypothetical protein